MSWMSWLTTTSASSPVKSESEALLKLCDDILSALCHDATTQQQGSSAFCHGVSTVGRDGHSWAYRLLQT